MSCLVCGQEPKYKCPNCRESYCSMECCKIHKETPCTAPVIKEEESNVIDGQLEYDFPTEDTVQIEHLKLLETSPTLRQYLQNPHLRRILEKLDKSTYPDELMQEYMQEPIFIELVDECLKIVQHQE